MTKEHSGLTRIYLPTFSLNVNVPSVLEIDSKSEIGKLFTDHVTKNHKGLNWKIFRYTLNPANYKSFMYAFALTAFDSNPATSTVWQFSSCARRLKRAIERNGIVLSKTESDLIQACIYYQLDGHIQSYRDKKYTEIIEDLKKQYLG